MPKRSKVPVLNVARSWCGAFRRRGDGHNMMFCAACNRSKRAYWRAIRLQSGASAIRIDPYRRAESNSTASVYRRYLFVWPEHGVMGWLNGLSAAEVDKQLPELLARVRD